MLPIQPLPVTVTEEPKWNLVALGAVWIKLIYIWREDIIWKNFSHHILTIQYILQWNQMHFTVCQWALQDKRPCSFRIWGVQCLLNEWVKNQLMVNEKCLGSIHFLFPCSQLFTSETYTSALLEKDQNGTVPPCSPSLYLVPNHLYTCILLNLTAHHES